MKFSVTQNGKKLSEDLYNWDEETRTFSTNEEDLVLDFNEYDDVTFDTGPHCTFKTGSNCVFNTISCCTFKTGPGCTFKTGSHCTFKTGPGCTFDTGSSCIFDTGPGCTFDTGSSCIFDTGPGCTFDTGSRCTFDTGSSSVIIRRDEFEVITLEEGGHIKLNEFRVKGYTHIKDTKTITIDGKDIEISLESFEALKEQLISN